MSFWITLWKAVFIVSVSAFSLMSIWVTIWGARDIKSLLTLLKNNSENPQEK